MFDMKNTWKAAVSLGLTLLLGSTYSVATIQQLDGASPPMPTTYAQELLKPGTGETVRAVSILSDLSHPSHKLVVAPKRVLEEGDDVYIRIELGGGMVFAKSAIDLAGAADTTKWEFGAYPSEALTLMCDEDDNDDTAKTEVVVDAQVGGTAIVSSHSSGAGKGDPYAVYRLTIPTGGIPLTSNEVTGQTDEDCNLDEAQTKIWVDIIQTAAEGGYLAIPGGPGSYTASISMHSDADDAQGGSNPSSALAGDATIVRAVNALDVEVMANLAPAVAQVNSTPNPFLWFAGGATEADLGHAKAEIGTEGLINPKTGMVAMDSELIDEGSLVFTVEGNFSIGAFNLSDPAACPAAGTANAAEPVKGNLVADEDLPANIRKLTGQNAGNYRLCVQVNVQGPNMTPIHAGSYTAKITQGSGALEQELASGVIGVIKRNGASTNLTYLTVSEKYNQRLIIVNNGANDARYDIGPFATEDGTTAVPEDMASGMVPAGEQVVIKVSDIVSFRGPMARASASISLNADASDIHIATTQVNLSDGSTDTVVYDTEGT